MKRGRWGPYRQASPQPARHRPGARSARRERCLSIRLQTKRRGQMKRLSITASFALAVVAVLGDGTATLIAANGDEVYADVTGYSVLVEPGIILIVENAVITGGTGRYAGATGSYTS